jgi:hypothetical protein
VTLTATRFNNANTFYGPTVAPGTVTLTAARFDNTNAFYAPTVTPGAVTLTPDLFTNGNTFYAATVTSIGPPQTLSPPFVANDNQFFGCRLELSKVVILRAGIRPAGSQGLTRGTVSMNAARNVSSARGARTARSRGR